MPQRHYFKHANSIDSASRDFLFRTLSAFHFGPSFIQWIYTFYNNISSCVLNNGFSTAPFEVQRGVRQVDPLSSYLFIIVLDILNNYWMRLSMKADNTDTRF